MAKLHNLVCSALINNNTGKPLVHIIRSCVFLPNSLPIPMELLMYLCFIALKMFPRYVSGMVIKQDAAGCVCNFICFLLDTSLQFYVNRKYSLNKSYVLKRQKVKQCCHCEMDLNHRHWLTQSHRLLWASTYHERCEQNHSTQGPFHFVICL